MEEVKSQMPFTMPLHEYVAQMYDFIQLSITQNFFFSIYQKLAIREYITSSL